jgi:ubiquinone/menaquinone biosynthesis C-methylase UbiE
MSDTAQLFNDGQAYERLMGRWSQIVGRQFLDWLGQPKGLRWLDVGCGNGAFTEVLIERCAPASVAAIDPSEGQIAFARSRPGAKLAEFRVGDAQSLPYGDAEFDVATMALVISFIPDPARAVREMARVVRSGGWAATYMWDFESNGAPIGPMYLALEAIGMPRSRPPNWQAASQQAMRGLWESAGMQSVETRAIRIPVSFANFEDFWASNAVPVGPQGQAIAKLSAADRERLRNRLREQLPTGQDGRITYEASANAVKGRVPG